MSVAALAGARALVTGASRGIGRGIAEALAAAGAEVVLVSRSAHQLDAVAAAIVARGGSATALACDVTDQEQVRHLAQRAGPIDVLVNNAGANRPEPFLDVAYATFERLLQVNLTSTFFVSQALARGMVERGAGGAIVNVTSQMGHVGGPNRSVYCSAKHAVEGLTRALAVELAPHQVRVNAVAPTYIETALTAPFLSGGPFRDEALGRIPLGRFGQVSDVAGAVVFLASPAASMITGASLLIDGGYTAQ